MKKSLRFAALCLALMMLLATAFAQETATTEPTANPADATQAPEASDAPEEDVVLATFDGEPIYKSECDSFISYYSSSYSLTYSDAVDNLLHQKLFEKMIKELAFDQFTQEEMDGFTAKAQADWDEAINSYVEYFLSEDTEQARADMLKQANEYYTSYGYSVEMLADNYKRSASYDKLEKYLVGDNAVTDEEIQAKYDETITSQKESIGDSATMYEMYNYYYGGSWYVPAGYRSVLHILMSVDSDLLTAYQTAQDTYDTLVSKLDEQNNPTATPDATATPEAEATAAADATPEAPVTQADVDAAKEALNLAKNAVLESKKTEIDDIMTRLAAGEDFKTLIEQYNVDSGEDVEKGYYVHKDSILWDTAFRDAAFSDKMQKIGDHSDPVVGANGIHILYYLADVPEGGEGLTDEIRASIKEELYNNKVYDAQVAAYDEKIGSCQVVYNTELIEGLDKQPEDTTEATEAPAEQTSAAPEEATATVAP